MTTSILAREAPDVSRTRPTTARSAGIYYLHSLQAGPLASWDARLRTIAAMGFGQVLISPPFQADDAFVPEDFERPHRLLETALTGDNLLHHIADACRAQGLDLLLDFMPDHVAADGRIARARPELFDAPDPARALDPRSYRDAGDVATLRYEHPDAAAFLAAQVQSWRAAGVAGVRFSSLRRIPPATLRALRGRAPDAMLLGWTPGLPAERIEALAGCGLDYVFASLPWWNWRDEWLWRELDRLRRVARVIAPVEAPFGPRLGAAALDPRRRAAAVARAVAFAAQVGDGWLLPMGCESDAAHPLDPRGGSGEAGAPAASVAEAIRAANRLAGARAPARLMTPPGDDAMAVLRVSDEDPAAARLLLANASLEHAVAAAPDAYLHGWQPERRVARLGPGESAALAARAPTRIVLARPLLVRAADAAARAPRIAIENVQPSIDQGRFAARFVVGETVRVGADIICDGHDQLAAVVLWRGADEATWRQSPMQPQGNDRWEADLPLTRVGRWVFTVEAWRDAFGAYRDELRKKYAAGVDIALELQEGQQLLAAAAERVPALAPILSGLARRDVGGQVDTLLAPETARLMAQADTRPFAVRHAPLCLIDADRIAAQFAAWYEVFPRSMSDDATRHGRFADVEKHLPRIRDMGFDVLYFPPIHPIGRTNRKGRNNTLTPAPDDPGSPYAIGDETGGHDAIHAELGTLEDFRHLREAAAAHGLELAMDFAIQCSPDHPWLKQHREWFDWRIDGSLRYAENPPKKYQDIVNVDFYAPGAVPDLWVALCDVVLFWASQGVKIYRVDNPHTKPLPFWEWLIAEVRARHPDAIFLAEAFTKPKMMNRLAKLGFTQSYTYFTWRNTAREMQAYLTELTTTDAARFFRPNFFVNTPDINPVFLQSSGRPGFLIRAALAATLAGVWGVYSGFDLCEGAALPGREEYLDSEKYQLRAWDWQRPGNIVAEITALNRIRRLNPALHSHLGVHFLETQNPNVLAYERATPDRRNVLLVAVSFDPFARQDATLDIPLWRWTLPDNGKLRAESLPDGEATVWQGRARPVTLDPSSPYRVWRVHPA